MEINQPGITKIVQKLLARGLIESAPDAEDGRKKWLRITPRGLAELHAVYTQLAPDVEAWFTAWSEEKLVQFKAALGDLAAWLDSNRLEP